MDILTAIRERLTPAAVVDAVMNFRPSRGDLLKAGAYLLYGVMVFSIVFAAKYYVRQTDELARKAVSGLDGVVIEFPYLEPQLFPPRVTLDYLRVLDAKTKKPIVLMRDADVRVSVLPLLMGKASISLTSRMYGGLVEADVTTGAFFNVDRASLDVRMEMVELERIPQVKQYDKSLKGFASIDASLDGEWRFPFAMEGSIVASLDQLDMENRFPVVKGARLKGFDMDIDCVMEDGVWSVARFDLVGKSGISLKSAGTVTVDQQDFNKSVLDMKGSFLGPPNQLATSVLDPKAVEMLKKKQVVPVAVTGMLGSPAVVLR